MRTRSILAGACALCLAVPVAAGAKPGGPVFVGHIHHAAPAFVLATGDTKNDLHVIAHQQGITGDTKSDLPGATTPAPGPTATPVTTTPAAAETSDDGWQIAALAEGGLLAIVAVGAAATLTARSRRRAHPGV
jgi:hypothetical protein